MTGGGRERHFETVAGAIPGRYARTEPHGYRTGRQAGSLGGGVSNAVNRTGARSPLPRWNRPP